MTGQEACDWIDDLIEWMFKNRKDNDWGNESINWADCSVIDIQKRESLLHDGDIEIWVTISEASPDVYYFRKYIGDKFFEKFDKNIYVETEW